MNTRLILSVTALLLAAVASGSAETLTPGNGAMTVVNGGTVVLTPPVWWADMGEYYGNGRAYVVPLQLPVLPAGASFGDADIAFSQHGPGMHPDGMRSGFYGGSAPNYNIDLYGLPRVAADETVIEADHFSGPADATATLLQDAFLDPLSPGNRTVIHTTASGDMSLTAWLNAMYAGGANAGLYVFLRLNPDGIDGTLPWSGYQVMTAMAGGADEKPVLTYSVVPEPAAFLLLAVCAMIRRPR